MSEFDAVQSLRDAGLLPDTPESHLEEGHKGGVALEVLSTLTESEVAVLRSIRERMDASADSQEVMAHSNTIGNGFW
ncbi:aroma-sacti cluster domain-containing protein [Nonomuraea sp. NPDC049784]|uniref:aroma-sacti cluster domain-containing protein n=1 Tax=Nonomuraea sp. NPDC049784 TaxID=3154361 RepID=UPI0033E7DE36